MTFLVQVDLQEGETFCSRFGADPLDLARVVAALSNKTQDGMDFPEVFFDLVEGEHINAATLTVLASIGLKTLVEKPETLFLAMTDIGQGDGEEDS